MPLRATVVGSDYLKSINSANEYGKNNIWRMQLVFTYNSGLMTLWAWHVASFDCEILVRNVVLSALACLWTHDVLTCQTKPLWMFCVSFFFYFLIFLCAIIRVMTLENVHWKTHWSRCVHLQIFVYANDEREEISCLIYKMLRVFQWSNSAKKSRNYAAKITHYHLSFC